MINEYDTDPRNYQICSVLGQCSSEIGTVYSARHHPTRTIVAVKKFNLETITREEAELVKDEIIIMRQLSHPNIIKCLTAFVSGVDVVAVLPLMGYGSCHDIMLRYFQAGLPEEVIACVLKSVLHALTYLHTKGIIHRAVRASHILIGAEGNIILSGLRYFCPLVISGRWVRKVHSFPLSTLPNLNWLSPELLEQNLEGYNEKSDVYSVGVTACELANGIVPFWDTPKTFMLTEKVKGALPQLLDASTYVPIQSSMESLDGDGGDALCGEQYIEVVSNRSFSDNFHNFSELCMRKEVDDRPSSSQLLSHSFLKHVIHYSLIPKHILPAVPIIESSVVEVQEDLESMIAAEKLNNLELNSVSWDFS